MYYLFFILGVLLGSICAMIFSRRKTSYGFFVINPVVDPDDPNKTNLGIKIVDVIDNDTKRIVLYKERKSQ